VVLLSPGEPVLWLYNGGPYAIYPSMGLVVGCILTAVIGFIGCCAVCSDSKIALIVVSDYCPYQPPLIVNNLTQRLL